MQEPDDQSTRVTSQQDLMNWQASCLMKKRKSWEENPSISVHG
jgi:hypothetical protein